MHHDTLLEVAYNEGVKGFFSRVLESMYNSLVPRLRMNNERSGFFQWPVRIRRGCVKSPTLFSLFINTLAKHSNETGIHGVQLLLTVLELFLLLFTNDIILLSTTPGGLQAELNLLRECCGKLKLSVNNVKTQFFFF